MKNVSQPVEIFSSSFILQNLL